MAITLAVPATNIGAGFVLIGPIGSTEPTNTVSGSVFTDSWDPAWVVAGATESGSVFNYQTKVTPVDAAEYLDPLAYETDGREGNFEFTMIHIAARTLKFALNGGTTTVTGSGATTMTKYEPPDPGNEVRQMIGWESRDHTQRLIMRQCFQGGQIQAKYNKGGANKTGIAVSYMFEVPATGLKPWSEYFAGTARSV